MIVVFSCKCLLHKHLRIIFLPGIHLFYISGARAGPLHGPARSVVKPGTLPAHGGSLPWAPPSFRNAGPASGTGTITVVGKGHDIDRENPVMGFYCVPGGFFEGAAMSPEIIQIRDNTITTPRRKANNGNT